MYSGTHTARACTYKSTVYTHELTFSCESSSHKSRQLVSLRDSQKSLRSHWSRERVTCTPMHTVNESKDSCAYSIYEHKSILMHKWLVNTPPDSKSWCSLIFTIFLPYCLFFSNKHRYMHTDLWKVFPLTTVTPSHTFIDSHVCIIIWVLFWKSCTFHKLFISKSLEILFGW